MSWNPFRSIRSKTALIFFGAFVVIVLPVNFLVYSNVKEILIQADTRELQAEGEKLLDKVRLDPLVIPLPPNKYYLFLRVEDAVGTDTLFVSPGFPALWNNDLVVVVDSLKVVTQIQPVSFSRASLLLSVARNTNAIDSQLNTLQLYLFIASTVSILMAGLVVYLASGWTLRPIRNIIEGATHIQATRSMGRVIEPKTSDEYRDLAQTINGMLTRIETSIKTQTNFFASAAHELKTPLTVMQTELSVAMNQDVNPAVKSILQNQLDEVQRLDRVIQDFLLISQLKAESLVIRKGIYKLDEALYSALKRCKYLIKNKNVQINVTLDIEDCEACFDYDKIELVLTNLLENAIKYRAPDEPVKVVIKRAENLEVLFENSVNEFIPDLNLLKDEFKKVNEFSSGLGMGLWICNEIMKLHEGKLAISQVEENFVAKVVL